MKIDRVKIMSDLQRFEIEHDVASFQVEGVTLWPILRWYAYRDLLNGQHPSPPKKPATGHTKSNLKQNLSLAAGRIFQLTPIQDGLLFATRAEDYNQSVGGYSMCPYLDAIWDIATQEYSKCTRIEIDAGQKSPTSDGLRFFRSHYVSTFPFVRARIAGVAEIDQPVIGAGRVWEGFEKLFDRKFDYFPYENVIREFLGYYDFYKILLPWLRPRVAFAVSPFDIRSAALAAAGRLSGTTTVTIQYGVKSTLLLAKWGSIPESGYDVFANFVWAREEGMAKLVTDWNCPAHNSAIGGHPWLEWIDSQRAPTVTEKVFLTKLQPKGTKAVLITTQGNRIPKIVVEAMKLLQDEAFFFIRLHPVISRLRNQNGGRVGPEEIELMKRRGTLLGLESEGPVSEEWLTENGIKNFEFLESSNIPLPSLFSITEHHVTHRSSSASEAAAFGIPTTFIDPIGMSYDEELAKIGIYGAAETVDELVTKIRLSKKTIFGPESRPAELLFKSAEKASEALKQVYQYKSIER